MSRLSPNERRRKEIAFAYRWGVISGIAAERGIDPEELTLTEAERILIRETFRKFVALSRFDIQIAGIPPARLQGVADDRRRP